MHFSFFFFFFIFFFSDFYSSFFTNYIFNLLLFKLFNKIYSNNYSLMLFRRQCNDILTISLSISPWLHVTNSELNNDKQIKPKNITACTNSEIIAFLYAIKVIIVQ